MIALDVNPIRTKRDARCERIWRLLEAIPDPEIPAINIVELGIVRAVIWGEFPEIAITPTYVGCPALDVIREDIAALLKSAGFANARVVTKLSPAWTTDWISAETKAKLHAYGIAPPTPCAHQARQFAAVSCPRCGSTETELVSEFGATPCKAAMRCISCLEPFERFKCV